MKLSKNEYSLFFRYPCIITLLGLAIYSILNFNTYQSLYPESLYSLGIQFIGVLTILLFVDLLILIIGVNPEEKEDKIPPSWLTIFKELFIRGLLIGIGGISLFQLIFLPNLELNGFKVQKNNEVSTLSQSGSYTLKYYKNNIIIPLSNKTILNSIHRINDIVKPEYKLENIVINSTYQEIKTQDLMSDQKEICGIYDSKTKNIEINLISSSIYCVGGIESVTTHEIGHWFWYNRVKNEDKRLWEFAFNQGQSSVDINAKKNSTISEYAATNLDEDFAETFNYKLTQPLYYNEKLKTSEFLKKKDAILTKYLK